MVWFDSIYKLQYYNQILGVPCYCEQLVFASDLKLQALISGNQQYEAKFYVYSADGVTEYEDATDYFEYYFATVPNSGQNYMNARLASFAPTMCSHKCFIIRLVITQSNNTVVFDKYTERYCVNECCDTARDITIQQSDIEDSGNTLEEAGEINIVPQIPTGECGEALIRLISNPDCADLFCGNYYGEAGTILTGGSGDTNYNYSKTSTFKGRIVGRPREIKWEISYNCRPQRVESTKQYLLEAFEYFPEWKMNEIECQLHANHIYVDDFVDSKEYKYYGGTPFDKVSGARSCDEVFKLEATLQDCTIRQIFGCGDGCVQTTTYFLIPQGYQGGNFYGENGLMIATTYDGNESSPYEPGLLQWLASQDGVTSVEDIDVSGLDCEIYALVGIQSTGYIPSSIYFDRAMPANRIYSATLEGITDICGYTGETPCIMPVNDTVIITPFVCNTPENDTVIITEITTDVLDIINYGSWVQDTGNTDASIYANQVTINIKTVNTTVIGEAAAIYTFTNEIIATISAAGNPSTTQILNSSNTGALTGNQVIIINTNGTISFSGDIALSDLNEATIDFDNLVYNIN